MRTNGFALFRGPGARETAEGAVKRVGRYAETVRFVDDVESEGQRDGQGLALVALGLGRGAGDDDDDDGLPVVHGFLEPGAGPTRGEYALLGAPREGGEGILAERDALGTRPLYFDLAGTCVATDHRFFSSAAGSRPTLVGPGGKFEVGALKGALAGSGEEEKAEPVDRLGPLDLDGSTEGTASLLRASVRKRVAGRRKVAVSFSGGLDSSLIAMLAAREGVEVILCSAYVTGSRDERQAQRAADLLGLELHGVNVDAAASSSAVRTLDLPFVASPMDRALWVIYSTTAKEASSRGAEVVLLGQLADELFGGYMKYARAARERGPQEAVSMMSADVRASGERAFIRDELAVAQHTEARFPFADDDLVRFASRIPFEQKVAPDGERKLVLRRVASLLGLPDELADAPKKAAQYSSGVAKLV